MKVMLTGGCGHIGRVVAARLSREHQVVIVDRVPHPGEWAGRVELLDLTSSAELDRLDEPFDAVVHLAAIPNPYHDPWEEVLRANLTSTLNVLRYAAERGVPRVIFGSSESAGGWGIHRTFYRPDYLPIDERHRDRPAEVYSFTKCFGDQLCRAYSDADGLQTVCLRYTWVVFEGWFDYFAEQVTRVTPRDALGGTYCWICVDDVAEAVACALAMPMAPGQSETFYLTAAETFSTAPTLELAERNWGPGVPHDADYYAGRPHASFFDLRQAERLLGWRPAWDVARMVAERGGGNRKM